MNRVIEHLLAGPVEPVPVDGVDGWWSRHREAVAGFEATQRRAMVGGFAAAGPGWAFASGYQEALRKLVPRLADDKTALCATEKGGGHPRAIETRLVDDGDGWRLSGRKEFTTLGTHADALLVVATMGVDDAGRNRLCVVRVPAAREGVVIEPMPELPFVPEIPHAVTELRDVRVEAAERLPGDGYADYLKPFRTIEDCHVFAAILGWLVGVGRRAGWARDVCERLIAVLCALDAVAKSSPKASGTHVALGGVLSEARSLIATLDPLWEAAGAETAETWQRDRALLGVAGKARAKRLEVAWQRLALAREP